MEVNPHLNEGMNKLELKKQKERARESEEGKMFSQKIWLLFAWKYFPSNWREMNRKMEWQTWRTRNVLNCASLCATTWDGVFLASVHLSKNLNFKMFSLPLTYWQCLFATRNVHANKWIPLQDFLHQIISHPMSVCSITANSLNTNLPFIGEIIFLNW